MSKIHPALAEHAMRDNAKLQARIAELEGQLAALSQQAEPTDTFTAVDMATAAAQGFRDGQAATVKDCLTVQPMAYAVFAANGNAVCFSTRRDHPSLVALEKEGHSVVSLAPIAQADPQPERSGLNDDSKEAAMQKAFELGGLEDGSYHLESDELELVIRSALTAQGESHE